MVMADKCCLKCKFVDITITDFSFKKKGVNKVSCKLLNNPKYWDLESYFCDEYKEMTEEEANKLVDEKLGNE